MIEEKTKIRDNFPELDRIQHKYNSNENQKQAEFSCQSVNNSKQLKSIAILVIIIISKYYYYNIYI